MGVLIECWRARIGLNNRLRSRTNSSLQGKTSRENFILTVMTCFVLAILLLIGNVELNPGPEGTYKCSRCSRAFDSLIANAGHQRVHSLDANFFFTCVWPTCHYISPNYSSFIKHLNRAKHELVDAIVHVQPECSYSNAVIVCNVVDCNVAFGSVSNLCHHLLSEHFKSESSSEKSDKVICPFSACRSSAFPSKGAFSTHLGRSHKGWMNMEPHELNLTSEFIMQEERPISCSSEVNYDPDPQDVEMDDPYFDAEEEVETEFQEYNFCTDSNVLSDEELYDYVGKFYLLLEGQYLLPSSTVQKVAEYMTFLSEVLHSRLRTSLANTLQEINLLSEDQVNNIVFQTLSSDILYNSHHKHCVGPDLVSAHLRKEFYKSHFKYMDPQEVFLTRDRVHSESVQYVPLRDTLNMLLADPIIQQDVWDSFSNNCHFNHLYSDYFNGSLYRDTINRPELPRERIDLYLFQDGFSCSNPIGSAKTKHNVVGTYVSIANLKPHNRTKIDSIRLVMMALNKHIKKYGFGKCYEKLVQDLKDLFENGILVRDKKIPVYLMFVIGDNLGQNGIGGFIESFSKNYFCRFCTISKSEMLQDITVLKSMRTPNHYRSCLFKKNLKGSKHCLGIKANSILNSYLRNWNVCDPRLAPCLGHDLFHGVVDWDLSAIISHLVKKKWFSYDLLNKRIAAFKLRGSDSPNKPAQVHKDGKKLGGHAVQNWCLLRLFPLIMEGYILDPSDKKWQLYLKLKKITEYICAPIITVDQINELERLLHEYMKERSCLGRVRPKNHVILHYPNLIRIMGPLIHLWTLRFEHKHSFFKRVARACQNFINLSRTLALHHQLNVSSMSTGSVVPQEISDCSPKQSNLMDFDESVKVCIVTSNKPADAEAVHHVTFRGTKYKEGDWIVLSCANQDIVIGCMEAILLCGSDISLICKHHIAKFDKDNGLYKISDAHFDISCVELNTIGRATVQPVYDFEGSLTFSLKNSLPDQSL